MMLETYRFEEELRTLECAKLCLKPIGHGDLHSSMCSKPSLCCPTMRKASLLNRRRSLRYLSMTDFTFSPTWRSATPYRSRRKRWYFMFRHCASIAPGLRPSFLAMFLQVAVWSSPDLNGCATKI